MDSFHFSEPLTDLSITSEQMYDKLKLCKSAGSDGLHPMFLKETAAELSKPLHVFNFSQVTG